ncbi:MAG: hypothetical protein QXX08_03075 [Candidatus Bathyarchaeia archaeon]
MCEFDLVIDGKVTQKEVIYAKVENNKVIVKDVIGKIKEYSNYRIKEVDVNSTRLVLSLI